LQVSETFQLLQPYNLHKCLKVTSIRAASGTAQPHRSVTAEFSSGQRSAALPVLLFKAATEQFMPNLSFQRARNVVQSLTGLRWGT